jgi:septal ring factor EnvC (AmiA/AmiB activator)
MSTQVEEMFEAGTEQQDLKQRIKPLAEFIAREDDALKQMKKDLSERKANLDQCKADLANLLRQNGIEKVKLDNGLTPKAVVKTKFYKQSGISDEQLQGWLKQQGLGEIIKPYVHFGTLQSTLQSFVEQGNSVPEDIINVSKQPTVTMYGRSKYLSSKS